MKGPEGKEPKVSFFSDEIVPELLDQPTLAAWIAGIVDEEGKTIEKVIITLVDDDTLLGLNKRFLQHDTLTDILTFPYSYDPINTEILISIDRVRENASDLGIAPVDELNRVIIHGILHMCGWDDKSPEQQLRMRSREQECLDKLV